MVYVRQALLDYDKMSALQEQLACPNNKYSTLLHEYIHWFDAQRYRTKHGEFNNADDYDKYIAKLNKRCKKNLDKNGIKVYNASDISKYAGDEYVDGNYYETYTEYRVVEILGG